MTRLGATPMHAAEPGVGFEVPQVPQSGPLCARLSDGRLHLQHGPMDLVIGIAGDPDEVRTAEEQAVEAFAPILSSLVKELPVLKQGVTPEGPRVSHPVAQIMVGAVRPYCERFITPMAAVAGSVAQYVLDCALDGRTVQRAYVNNGGDIALWLGEGSTLTLGVVARVDAPSIDRRVTVTPASHVRGIATSGWGGRSFSLGIADAVTVFARDASSADAAATVVANAVNADHPGVRRAPANSIQPDSDLGDLPVTVGVDIEEPDVLASALDSGAREAERWVGNSTILGALIFLKGYHRAIGWPPAN